jgi:hypothetical protein
VIIGTAKDVDIGAVIGGGLRITATVQLDAPLDSTLAEKLAAHRVGRIVGTPLHVTLWKVKPGAKTLVVQGISGDPDGRFFDQQAADRAAQDLTGGRLEVDF